MRFSIARAISREQYDDWLGTHRGRLSGHTPFHQLPWLDAVAAGAGFDLAFVGLHDGGELVAVVPGFLKRYGPFQLFGSPLRGTMTAYLGPIALVPLSDDDRREAVDRCARFARRHWRVSYAEFALREPLPALDDGGGAAHDGWQQDRPPTFLLDLTPGEAAVRERFRPRCRRHIARSERAGIDIVPYGGTARAYARMLDDTFERRASARWHSERFFHALLTHPALGGHLWVLGARYEGETIAAGLFLHDDEEVHYLSGASLTRWRSLPTSYLMHWHAMQRAMGEGKQRYDFGGTGPSGIRAFKLGFGAKPENYWNARWVSDGARLAQRLVVSSVPRLRRMRAWMERGPGALVSSLRRTSPG